jgi:hypothetical protein
MSLVRKIDGIKLFSNLGKLPIGYFIVRRSSLKNEMTIALFPLNLILRLYDVAYEFISYPGKRKYKDLLYKQFRDGYLVGYKRGAEAEKYRHDKLRSSPNTSKKCR